MRASILSGQAHGKVDWVTSDGREFGMFLRVSDRETTRLVVRGPEAEAMLSNRAIQKGMMVTGFGEFSARAQQRHDDGSTFAEVLCTATKIVAEPPKDMRLRGAINVNLKGVVMYWDAARAHIKTFLNAGEHGRTEQVTCNVYLTPWLRGLTPEGRERLISSVSRGREYTVAALSEASYYREGSGKLIPVLSLLPYDFRLQG